MGRSGLSALGPLLPIDLKKAIAGAQRWLNNPVTPMQAETALQLTLAPKADTARYDRLRPTHLDDQEVRHA